MAPFIAFISVLVMMGIAAVALAHPMGNFTISQYTAIRLDAGAAVVRYRVDMAELPTADELPNLDTNSDGKVSPEEIKAYLARKVPELTLGQTLRINDAAVPMTVVRSDMQVQRGDGGLPTLFITIDYRAALAHGRRRKQVELFVGQLQRPAGLAGDHRHGGAGLPDRAFVGAGSRREPRVDVVSARRVGIDAAGLGGVGDVHGAGRGAECR